MFKFLVRLPKDVNIKLDALAEVRKNKMGDVDSNKAATIRELILADYKRAVKAGEIIERDE